jgi:hypothetical protein
MKGVDPVGSKKAWDLYMKTKYLETVRPGRNLVLASGTPLTNTIGEAFTMQRLMKGSQLIERGINSFDAWSSVYATTVTNLEKQPSGTYKNVTRLARFMNLRTLSLMIREFMDVVTSKQLGNLVQRPNIRGGKINIMTSQPTMSFKSYQKFLEKRMDAIAKRRGKPEKGQDIILNVINDGRHAAIDMRLIDPTLPPQDSKLENMIKNVYEIWKDSSENEYKQIDGSVSKIKGATQMIFSDLGIKVREKNGKRFSAYTHIYKRLVEFGVPAEQIAFMRDYEGHDEKRRLFARMNSGEVRILIGSTINMGTGVNAQRRLKALHNLDAPWIPSDLEQRHGRILRQGNQNSEIDIYGYGTEGSYDSTMWGLLEVKQNAIDQFLSSGDINEMGDIGDESQTDSMRVAKAMTSGDPRIIAQAALIQEVRSLERKFAAFGNEQSNIDRNISSDEARIQKHKRRIETIKTELLPKRTDIKGDKFSILINGVPYTERKEAGEALLDFINRGPNTLPTIPSDGIKVAEMAGFNVNFFRDDAQFSQNQYSIYFDEPILREDAYEYGTGKFSKSFSPLGLMATLGNQISKLEEDIGYSENDIVRLQRNIATLKSQQSDEFKDKGKLIQKRQELEDLEKDLKTNAAAQEVIDEWPDELPGPHNKTMFSIIGYDNYRIGPSARRAGYSSLSNKAQVEIQKALRSRLDEVGLKDVDINIVPDVTSSTGEKAAGSYSNKVISVAMSGGDPIETLNHEIIHALKAVGAFTPGDWKRVESEAKAKWRIEFKTDENYKDLGLNDDELNEEAVADAFKAYNQNGIGGWFKRVYNRVSRLLREIAGVLSGERFKFRSAADVFDAINRGDFNDRSNDKDQMDDKIMYAFNKKGKRVHTWAESTKEFSDELNEWREGRKDNAVPGRSLIKSFLYAADSRMRSIADAMDNERAKATVNTILDMFHAPPGEARSISETFEEAVMSKTNKSVNDLADIFGDKDGDLPFLNRVVELVRNPDNIKTQKLRGKVSATTPEGNMAIKLIKWLDDNADYLEKAGVKFSAIEKGYFPRIYDEHKVLSREREAHEGAVKSYILADYKTANDIPMQKEMSTQEVNNALKQGFSDPDALDSAIARADAWIEMMKYGGVTGFVSHERGRPKPNFLKHRSWPKESDKIMNAFLEHDPRHTLVAHAARSVKRAELSRRFGDELEKWHEMEDQLKKLDSLYVVPDLRDYIATVAGIRPRGISHTTAVNLGWLRLIGTLGVMTRATMTSLSEFVAPAIRSGNTLDIPRALSVTLNDLVRSSSKNAKASRDLAEDLGLIVSHLSPAMMASRWGGGDFSTKLQRSILSKYFHRIFLEQWTSSTKVATVRVAQVFIRRHAMNYKSTLSKTLLQEIGIPSDQIEAFSKWLMAQSDGMPQLVDLYGTQDQAFAKLYRTALFRFVDQTILGGHTSNKPQWASTEFGKVIFQLNSYNWSFQKNVTNRQFHLWRQRDITNMDKVRLFGMFLPNALMLYAMAFLIGEARDLLFGDEKDKKKTVGEKASLALSRSWTGSVDPFYNLVTGIKYGRDLATSAAGVAPGIILRAGDVAIKSFAKNSEKTNTAERQAARAFYDLVIMPASQIALTAAPYGSVTAAAATQVIGAKQAREAFVSATAGKDRSKPQKPKH